MKQSITITEVINYLNELADIDREAIRNLVNARVRCTETLSVHPTAQVGIVNATEGTYEIGMLGLLNGVFGVDEQGYGPIMAMFSEEGALIGFRRMSDALPERTVEPFEFTDNALQDWADALPSLKLMAQSRGDVLMGAMCTALNASIERIQRDNPPVCMVQVPASDLYALVGIAAQMVNTLRDKQRDGDYLLSVTADEKIAFIEQLVSSVDLAISRALK